MIFARAGWWRRAAAAWNLALIATVLFFVAGPAGVRAPEGFDRAAHLSLDTTSTATSTTTATTTTTTVATTSSSSSTSSIAARTRRSTTSTAVAAARPRLPQPILPAATDYIDEPAPVIGRLEVPRLGLRTALHRGISLTSIDKGPSHWPGTAMPGDLGNVVVAGHRATRSRPFRHLDALEPGDQAIFTTDDGTFIYEFTHREVVTPRRIDIADQTPEYKATLFACHPPGSTRYRLVAYFRLASAPASAASPT